MVALLFGALVFVVGIGLIVFSPVPVGREGRFRPLIAALDGAPPGLFGYHPRWARYYYRTWPPGVAVAAAGVASFGVGLYRRRRRSGHAVSAERPVALGAVIEDVFDRLMALDGAMGALVDAEVGMSQALQHAEAVADIYRDRPEHAEALRRLDELRDVAYRTLDVLVRESPLAVDADDGPPARGSRPLLAAPLRARRDTRADSPRALREGPALIRVSPLLPSATPVARSDAHLIASAPAPMPDEEDVP